MSESIDRICECAIRLVHLGADCQVKLQIPAQRRNASVNPNGLVNVYRSLNFDGKTARELASMSRRRELIRAIELMQKPENVHLAQCRSGSRLPWNQCHGAPVTGQSNLYIRGDDGRMHWRYSPKARCPCYLTNKKHYKCCWFTSTSSYKNDTSGDLPEVAKTTDSTTRRQVLLRLEEMRIAEGMDPTGIAPQDLTSEEYRTELTDFIRSEGFGVLDDVNGRRSGVQDWDPMVYAGVVECFDTDMYFMWNDLH
jgi:hypothetical protein